MRYLKTLGLALVAALALTALTASIASAAFTGEGTGEHTVGGGANQLTAFGGVVACSNETVYHGSTVGTTLEVVPTYTGCTSGGGTIDVVEMNGCYFKMTAIFNIDLTCHPEGRAEVFVFAGETLFCTITIPEQTGLESLTYTDESSGGNHALRVHGTISGINAHREGFCAGGGTQETEEAELHVDITFNGIGI